MVFRHWVGIQVGKSLPSPKTAKPGARDLTKWAISVVWANVRARLIQPGQDPRLISVTVTKIIDIVESERRILFLKATMEGLSVKG
jgi:hypothetical protein